MVEKGHRAAGPAEFLKKQRLVDLAPGQTVRGKDGNDLHLAVADRVA
jgi:hypothetical protein